MTAAAVVPRWRKKFSIFTSAIRPYGLPMNAEISAAVMPATAQAKKASRRYFSPRSGMSSQRGAANVRPNSSRPPCHSHSEIVPTGQSQLQNAFRKIHDIATKATRRKSAAG